MDPKKKFFLFHQSHAFCSVPWNYFEIDSEGAVKTCAKGREILGNINNQSIHEILGNVKLKEIKQDLYNDKIPHNCTWCRDLDQPDSSYSYLRSMYNKWFVKSPVDYSDTNAFHLSGVDLHWSNTCNLRCVTCWAKQSSAIAAEQRIPIVNVPTQQIDSLIDWIVSQQDQLRELYFSGGEPTLIKHNIKLLKKLLPRDDLLIRINTNMTFDPDNEFIRLVSRFPNVLFTMSADAMTERFEYIRHGAKWSQFLRNLCWVKERNFQMRVNSVFFVASASTLMDTQSFFHDEFGISDFTINQCTMGQTQLRCRNLPDAVKRQVLDDLVSRSQDQHLDVNLAGQIKNCIDELQNDPDGEDYRVYFDNLDQRRATDWRSVFEELR
jgi:sulfatase maturation enzyme AslB (radical SAM superfamily)